MTHRRTCKPDDREFCRQQPFLSQAIKRGHEFSFGQIARRAEYDHCPTFSFAPAPYPPSQRIIIAAGHLTLLLTLRGFALVHLLSSPRCRSAKPQIETTNIANSLFPGQFFPFRVNEGTAIRLIGTLVRVRAEEIALRLGQVER